MKLTRRQLNALIESIILSEEEVEEEPEAEADSPNKEAEEEKSKEVKKKEEPEQFEFTLSVLGEKIIAKFSKNNNDLYEPISLECDNQKIQSLLSKASPKMILAICYEKMKDLDGLDDGDSKRKFANIAQFVRNYDLATKDMEDDISVFKKIQDYTIRYFKTEIKKITDTIEKNKM